MKIVESMEFEYIPSILVFNKLDQADAETEAALRGAFPQVPLVSAKKGKNFRELLLHIEKVVEKIEADAKAGVFNPEEKPEDTVSLPLLHSSF